MKTSNVISLDYLYILNKIYFIDYFEIFEEPDADPVVKMERSSPSPSTYFSLINWSLPSQKALSGSPIEKDVICIFS